MNKKETKFKETEIGEIPEDWEVEKVEDLVKHRKGYAFKSLWFTNSGRRIVKVSDFTSDSIDISKSLFIDEEKAEEFKDFELLKGDLVIATVGSWPNNPASIVGKVIKVPKIAEGSLLNQNAVILRVLDKNRINQLFLFYRLRTKDFSEYIVSGAQGSANQASITLRDIFGFEFGLPQIEEQEFIAKLVSDLDSKIELNQQMNKTLEAIGQTIFKRWFVDFEFLNEQGKPYKSSGGEMVESEFGKIPKGWKVSKIGDELTTILGGTPSKGKKEYWVDGDIPWINSGAINDFPIINASEHITKKGLNNSAAKLMPVKTTVLPFVISVGKLISISILGIETSGNQSVLGIVPNEKLPAEFIYYWIQEKKNEIYSWATGGAQQHINKGNVDSTFILIADKSVMIKYEKVMKAIFDKMINNALEAKGVSQVRDLILPKLMSGKIRVPVEVRR